MVARDRIPDRTRDPARAQPDPDPEQEHQHQHQPEPPRPVTLASRRGFDGKHLHVRVDTVRLPSGRESVREVVEHPGSVAVVALTANAKLILIRQFHHAIGRTLLGLPAGTAAAVSPLIAYAVSPGYTDETMTLVLAEGCVRGDEIAGPDESLLRHLVPLAEAEALLAGAEGPQQLADAKTLVGLLLLLLLRRRAERGDPPRANPSPAHPPPGG
ncbi:MAG: NUDIX hydrolase [Chloroflexia bacterium]|nr:NUDIX hydrolase [Chloroflexia bacterium]